jgi:AraC-like DNA-binding protein
MKAWRFSTESYPPHERAGQWRAAMHRLGLPVGELSSCEPHDARVTCLVSPLGMDFALIEADAQVISGRRTDQPAAVWLAVLLEGEATLESEGAEQHLNVGDIAYGPTGRAATLMLDTRCKIMFVQAPRVALDHRILAIRNLRVARLRGSLGVARIFSGLLRSTAEALPGMTIDHLRPVELAVTEFLAASLAEVTQAAAGAPAISPHLHRICQSIETLLADPDLSLKRLAERNGVSPRYIQKLFASADETFGHYLRSRRLERCRMDLASPVCAKLSISEICFRWGFNESAHFSRAFRNEYGRSPREYRREKPSETAPYASASGLPAMSGAAAALENAVRSSTKAA